MNPPILTIELINNTAVNGVEYLIPWRSRTNVMENSREEQRPSSCGNPKYDKKTGKSNPRKWRKRSKIAIIEVNLNNLTRLASGLKNDMID